MKNQFVPDSKHTPSTLKAPEVEVSIKMATLFSELQGKQIKLCGKEGIFL